MNKKQVIFEIWSYEILKQFISHSAHSEIPNSHWSEFENRSFEVNEWMMHSMKISIEFQTRFV